MLSDLLATHESGDEYYFEFENDEGTNRERARGLPIGNLTSQILANFYLTPFDRFIKEQLKISKYLRYMDDCLIFGDNKQEMIKVKQAAKDFLADYRLKLHEQKSQIFPRRNGIRFLGFHIYPNYRRIQRENLIRFKKRWNKKREQYSKGDIDFNHLRLSLNGWLGYSRYYDTAQIINTLLQNYKFKKNDLNECDFSFYLPQG